MGQVVLRGLDQIPPGLPELVRVPAKGQGVLRKGGRPGQVCGRERRRHQHVRLDQQKLWRIDVSTTF